MEFWKSYILNEYKAQRTNGKSRREALDFAYWMWNTVNE